MALTLPMRPGRTPRAWQLAAFRASCDGLRAHKSGIVQAATGAGKGDILAAIAVVGRGRVLVNVHRQDLVNDLAGRIRHLTDDVGVVMGATRQMNRKVVVGCTPSLHRRRDDLGAFSLLITDEAHMATSSTNRDLQRLAPLHLGFTATPFRSAGDGSTTGLGSVFRAIFYRYPIKDAIAAGDLCPIEGVAVKTRLSLESVATRNGDFVLADLAPAVDVPARNNLIIDHYDGRPGLAFCAGVAHAQHLADVARDRGYAAEAVWGDDPDRKTKLERFFAGTVTLLTSADLLLVGFDAPHVETILMARPTKSRVLWIQAVGRGTRLHPGKDRCLLYDFADVGMDLCGLEDLSEDDTLPVERRLLPFPVGAEVERKADGAKGVVLAVDLAHHVRWTDGSESWHDRCELRRPSDVIEVDPKILGVRKVALRLFDAAPEKWYDLGDGWFVHVRRKMKNVRGPFGWRSELVREVVYLRNASVMWAVDDDGAEVVVGPDRALSEFNWSAPKERAAAPASWKLPGLCRGEAHMVRAARRARATLQKMTLASVEHPPSDGTVLARPSPVVAATAEGRPLPSLFGRHA